MRVMDFRIFLFDADQREKPEGDQAKDQFAYMLIVHTKDRGGAGYKNAAESFRHTKTKHIDHRFDSRTKSAWNRKEQDLFGGLLD